MAISPKHMRLMEEKNLDSIENRANLTIIRYANCWEDADVLVKALEPKKGGHYLSIASGGDNSFALLANDPGKVLAIDLNPSQLACVELKREAFLSLSHRELLQFLGILPYEDRKNHYSKLRAKLSDEAKNFWDHHLDFIEKGIIHVGKFENYFKLFRTRCLPLIHPQKRIQGLLVPKSQDGRKEFYNKQWNNLRWKLLFKVFFSKHLMSKLGRDREFFKYVTTSVAARILSRAKYALSILPTDTNPYLEYILTGNFEKNLPFYLRLENFETIRRNLDKLVLFKGGLKEAFEAYPSTKFDGFNLSDIFEYMSPEQYACELRQILKFSNSGAKIAFWNMLAYRKEVPNLKDQIVFLEDQAAHLHKQDKAFFYQSFILGEAK